MNGQWKDVFIPEIPKFALSVAEGHTAKSSTDYDDGIKTEFSFCRFRRLSFHINKTEQKDRQLPWHFLVFTQHKLAGDLRARVGRTTTAKNQFVCEEFFFAFTFVEAGQVAKIPRWAPTPFQSK